VNGDCLFSQCTIVSNVCSACALSCDCYSAAATYGGGLSSVGGTATLQNCLIQGNTADTTFCGGYYVATLESAYGGGIYANASLAITNCIIAYNSTQVEGGTSEKYTSTGAGIYVDSASTSADIVNCTIAYNSSEGIAAASSSVQVMNSIHTHPTENLRKVLAWSYKPATRQA
jgi:hypothetical protein